MCALSMIRPTHGLRWRDNLCGPSNSAARRFRLELHAVHGVERDAFLCGARDCSWQRFGRICEDQRIVAGTAERYVELSPIDHLTAAGGVDADENAVDRGTLARVRSDCITVIEVREKF